MSRYTHTSADISRCGRYRYLLFRRWADGPTFIVVGLNPSTADAEQDDPTIRRCVGFAKREGCGALLMLNLFALRSTDPSELRSSKIDPVGPKNDDSIHDAIEWTRGAVLVFAWGGDPIARDRGAQAWAKQYPSALCFGRTKNGSPRHPLYLRADTPLVPYQHSPPEGDRR